MPRPSPARRLAPALLGEAAARLDVLFERRGRPKLRRPGLAAALLALAAAAASPASAAAAAPPAETPPWQAAERLRTDLLAAQSALLAAGRAPAARAVARARAHYGGELRAGVMAAGPDADAAARGALSDAARAARAGNAPALAAARGASRAALLRGAYAAALAAAGRTDPAAARSWLLLGDRTATRSARADADATQAVAALEAGRLSPRATRAAIAKDVLHAHQARLRELLDDVAAGILRRLPVRAAEAAGQAEGFFALLRLRYVQDRGEPAAGRAAARFAALRRAAAAGRATPADVAAAAATLEGFAAAPFTREEAARRAQQLLRLLALVPAEYGRGVDGTRVTQDFEIREATAFAEGAAAAFDDLADGLAERDPSRAPRARAGLDELRGLIGQARRTPDRVASEARVQLLADRTAQLLVASMPAGWTRGTDESDHDRIALALDRMEAAVGAGEHRRAEQARLEVHALFGSGSARRLQALDPGLATEVEGLLWFGAGGQPGLARLLADGAPRRDVRRARLALDLRLAESAATLGDAASRTSVVANAALEVFRGGLGAVLVLAAITASLTGARRRLRRPVLAGAALGLVVSLATWVLARTLPTSLERYGERLEAVVGLIAIGVLLLAVSWFFHEVRWSQWIGRLHRRRRQLEGAGKAGLRSAQALGPALVGLTSVSRDGFQTVLFLQSLERSGTAAVVGGAGLGLVLALAVAAATFVLLRRLPPERALVVTGVLIGLVLVVMAGQTARTMQGTGWLPTTPVAAEPWSWLGLWLGVLPTVQTLGAQLAAMAFVLGSCALARELRVRRPRRRATGQPSRGSTASSPPQGSEPDSREPATSQTEPASVMAASAAPARGR